MKSRLLLLAAAATVALVAAAPAFAQQNELTINFELTVEGTPPADATFFGQYPVEGASVRLTDPDGDGVYTGSMSGGVPDAGFRIVQGTGTEQTMTGVYPGEPVTVIEEFDAPAVEGGAATLSATVSFGGSGNEAVSATGVLEKPDMTTYMYGTHAITDARTGEQYALGSESVDLDAYVGEEVTVTGVPVPGYGNGQVEDGPALLEVSGVEPADPAEAMVAFELTLGGEVPENVSFYVESTSGPGGVICTTDAAANEEAGYPRCESGGEINRAEFPMPAGAPFDYRVLTSQGSELAQSVVDEGSVAAAETGLVLAIAYSFDGEDLNEDGVVDAADSELAVQVSDAAKRQVDPKQGRPLPVTGGAALAALLAGSALAAAGSLAYRRFR
jgi:hypothetical protein